jgi:hypothetical protein
MTDSLVTKDRSCEAQLPDDGRPPAARLAAWQAAHPDAPGYGWSRRIQCQLSPKATTPHGAAVASAPRPWASTERVTQQRGGGGGGGQMGFTTTGTVHPAK